MAALLDLMGGLASLSLAGTVCGKMREDPAFQAAGDRGQRRQPGREPVGRATPAVAHGGGEARCSKKALQMISRGNTKAVDIVVALPSGQTATIDVKGVAGPHDWPCDNLKFPAPAHHFIVLVSFEGTMASPRTVPSVWVVPANEIMPFVKSYAVRKVIVRSALRVQGQPFWQASWRMLGDPSAVCAIARASWRASQAPTRLPMA